MVGRGCSAAIASASAHPWPGSGRCRWNQPRWHGAQDVARDQEAGRAPRLGRSVTARPRSVDLYWLPLGAGGHCVSVNGRVYEAAVAAMQHRRRHDLYHSALEVCVPEGRFVIEMTPIRDGRGRERGVIAEGAVGSNLMRWLRPFRYEPALAGRLHSGRRGRGREPTAPHIRLRSGAEAARARLVGANACLGT